MHTEDPPVATDLPVDYLFELRVEFDPPMLMYPVPFGTRVDAVAARGRAEGPRLNGDVLRGSGDWLTVAPDGVAHMNVCATIRADSGEHVHYTSAGRTVLGPGGRDRFLAGETILGNEMYGRTTQVFETSSETYGWLNGIVAAGLVDELSLTHIRYRIFGLR
jgi:Protein of unknown function (DUF3237)